MDDDDGLTATPGGSGDAAAGATKTETPAPPREEMVANAVAFLRHPQVAASPEHSKRAFLEKKGLTEPEIAEAFRRVPQDRKADAADAADAKARANGASEPKGTKTHEGLRWTQVVARAGAALAAVSWAYKTFRPTTRAPGSTPPPSPPPLPSAATNDPERTAAAIAQAVAAAEAAKRDAADARARAAAASRALEEAAAPPSLTADDVSAAVEAAKRDLRRELESVVAKAVRDATRETETVGSAPLGSLATPEGVEVRPGADAVSAGVRRELAAIKAMLASSPLVAANAGVASSGRHTRRARDARGPSDDDRTPRVRADVPVSRASDAFGSEPEEDERSAAADAPSASVVAAPSAAEPRPRAALASSAREREAVPGASASPSTPTNGVVSVRPSGDPSTPADPPHPASYRDVLDMLDKGMTPPGIRDVDDKPPDPTRAVPRARIEPRRKPWEARTRRPALGEDHEDEDSRKAPFPDIGKPRPGGGGGGEDEDAAWRPPSVPSMSSEASDVLFGAKKKPPVGVDATADETRPFAGFDSPGKPSGSLAG